MAGEDKTLTLSEGEKVPVDGVALYEILMALSGPPHLIRELQVLKGSTIPGVHDPITKVIDDYNAYVRSRNG